MNHGAGAVWMLLSQLLNESWKLELSCVITFTDLHLCAAFTGRCQARPWPGCSCLWKLQKEFILIYPSSRAGKSHAPAARGAVHISGPTIYIPGRVSSATALGSVNELIINEPVSGWNSELGDAAPPGRVGFPLQPISPLPFPQHR